MFFQSLDYQMIAGMIGSHPPVSKKPALKGWLAV
jgi:hypothetical protein